MGKQVEILLYDIIGYDWWSGTGMTAKRFMALLKAANDQKPDEILLRINTPGGDTGEGIAMYNAMQRNPIPVNTVNDGMAYSMGAILLMGGKKISAAKNSTIMIHNCWGYSVGNAKDFRSAAEMCDAIDTGLAENIAERTGLSVDEVKGKWMDYGMHTLTARQALDEKLIDVIEEIEAAAQPDNLKDMSQTEVFAWFAKNNKPAERENFVSSIVKGIKDFFVEKPAAASPTPAAAQRNTDMTKIKISATNAAAIAALGLTFAAGETEREMEITAEQGTLLLDALATVADAKATAVQNGERLQTELDAANAKVTALEAGPGASGVAVAAAGDKSKPGAQSAGPGTEAEEKALAMHALNAKKEEMGFVIED